MTHRTAFDRRTVFPAPVRFRTVVVLAAALSLAACGSEPQPDSGGAELNRGLLSGAGAEAGSGSRSGADGSAGPLREVPLAELGFDRGSSEAPVRVIEMSDYGCGYCRRFHRETFPALREEFIESGMVEWKFVPYVTGMFDNSLAALRGAECTLEQSPQVFEDLDERLWREQPEWKGSDDPAGVVRTWAVSAGADADAFDDCIESGRRFERIAAAEQLARQLGVRGTPTFIVVGHGPLQGALPLETFRRVLRTVHREATTSGD
ncbi:MAG: thioredoxin domain-containing protein [Gemmatimonadota bacterium]|nr:thioredoxin domain-containing protein [Gemmatimonadota bacterium]